MFIGNTRDRLLDRAEPELTLSPVVVEFGKYMKIVVVLNELVSMNQPQSRSVLDVMRQAQQALAQPKTPSKTIERNNKDKLFNALVDYLEEHGLFWRADEVDSFGVNFVKSLCEVLWYIDGHHDTLHGRGCSIPTCFVTFQGFNVPERSKHRKRSLTNLSADVLEALASKLFCILQSSYFHRERWGEMKGNCDRMAHNLQRYADELRGKNKVMKLVHYSTVPWRSILKGLDLFYLKPTMKLSLDLTEINSVVKACDCYSIVDLLLYLPANSKRRYLLINKLKEGLEVPVALLVYSSGNNAGNSYFVWRVPDSSLDEAFTNSMKVIEQVKQSLPVYHTRAMQSEFIQKFGRITNAVQPAVLRYFYKDLTGDCSGSETLNQDEVDSRVRQAIEMEDPAIVMDLRHLNSGKKSKYDTFWEECSKYLEETVGTAVDDRRHTNVTHVATAISIRDFRDQVAKRCPDGTCIPSIEWVRLQFWPKLPRSKRALHHTGKFQIRFKVQQRQFRKDHPDSHYAACIFRYQREYAVSMKEHSMFLCLDDKHRIKVGEPGFPVAAAERGRRVLTAAGSSFLVGDHDFTKVSIVPSVVLDVSIPDDISGSWYSGQVNIGIKEGTFEASSPLRHVSELYPLIEVHSQSKPILFLYTDGGPDHRLTYLSVQLCLISLFLLLDLDYLCAARTAPFHSWRNPVERIMSIVNLGLQCVGLARTEMDEENERLAAKAGSMKESRSIAAKHTSFKEALLDSVAAPKTTLTQVFSRLQLKDKEFTMFIPASSEEMDRCWNTIQQIDPEITPSVTKATMRDHPAIQEFIDHCCRKRHYSFEESVVSLIATFAKHLDLLKTYFSSCNHYQTRLQALITITSLLMRFLGSQLVKSIDHLFT